MAGEEGHHILQALHPGVVQWAAAAAVPMCGVCPSVQQQGTHVNPAGGSSIVERGVPLQDWVYSTI